MSRFCTFIAVLSVACCSQASWYWPFGSDDEEAKREPRLSELIAPASQLMDDAADLAGSGQYSAAIEKYREALQKLDEIEEEYPERVKRPEFSSFRNKRLLVQGKIDALEHAQVHLNSKPVVTTDTRALAEKTRRKHWAENLNAAHKTRSVQTARKKISTAVGFWKEYDGTNDMLRVAGFISGAALLIRNHKDLVRSSRLLRSSVPLLSAKDGSTNTVDKMFFTDRDNFLFFEEALGEICKSAEYLRTNMTAVVTNYCSEADLKELVDFHRIKNFHRLGKERAEDDKGKGESLYVVGFEVDHVKRVYVSIANSIGQLKEMEKSLSLWRWGKSFSEMRSAKTAKSVVRTISNAPTYMKDDVRFAALCANGASFLLGLDEPSLANENLKRLETLKEKGESETKEKEVESANAVDKVIVNQDNVCLLTNALAGVCIEKKQWQERVDRALKREQEDAKKQEAYKTHKRDYEKIKGELEKTLDDVFELVTNFVPRVNVSKIPTEGSKTKAEGEGGKAKVEKVEKVESVEGVEKAEVNLDGVKAKNKREQAILDILKGDFAAADLLIEEALAVNPSDVVWLNLKAAKAAHAGNLEEAESALDLAIMTSPRSHCAYYNMVLLTLKKNPDAKDSARRYYETGRTYNGPKDETLEALFK